MGDSITGLNSLNGVYTNNQTPQAAQNNPQATNLAATEANNYNALNLTQDDTEALDALQDAKDNYVINIPDWKNATSLDKVFYAHHYLDKIGTAGDVFEEGLKSKWEYVSGQTSMPYGIIAPEDVKPGEKLPVMIFMHGSNEGSSSSSTVKRNNEILQVGNAKLYERTYERLVNKAGLEGFRGYIICPANTGESWLEREAQVAQVMDHFTKTHEIDYDNIALAGYSAGAFVIPEYLEKDESERNKDKDVNAFAPGGRYEVSKAAIMAGYNSNAAKRGNVQQEMAVWVGSGDSDSINSMKTNLRRLIRDENYHVVQGKGHGSFSRYAMEEDVDNNGRSDVLEFLFGDE